MTIGHGTRAPATGSILPQGALSAAAHGVTAIATFFAVIGMIRLMGRAGFGQFALAIQIVTFCSMLADFGIGPVIMRRMSIDPSQSGTQLAMATAARLMLLVPTWMLALGIGFALDGSRDFFLVVNLMLLNMVLSAKVPVLRGSFESLYRAHSRLGVPTLTMALDSVCLLLLVVFLPAYFREPVPAMALYTVSNLPGMVLMLVGTRRMLRGGARPQRTQIVSGVRELLRSSLPLALFLVLNALHVSIDSVYLKIFLGDEAVGSFNAALRIMTPLAVFPSIIALSVSPLFARASVAGDDGHGQSARLFTLSMKPLLAGSIAVAVFGAANAGLLLDLAFDGKYAEAALPMALLFLTFLPMSVNILVTEVNNARSALARNARAAGLLAVVSLVAGPPLILAFGVPGAVAAKALAIVAALVYFLRSLRGELDIRVPGLAARSVLLLLCTALPLLLIGADRPVLRNLAAITAFGVALIGSRYFTREEWRAWRDRLLAMIGRGA